MELALWDQADAEVAEVMIEFAGSGTDEPSKNLARATLHDRLLEEIRGKGHRQAGPVEWREYDVDAAPTMLENAGLRDHPNAAGLLEFLRRPETVLVVGSLCFIRRAS